MIWCIAALVLFVLEMFSGTFYMLVVSASLLNSGYYHRTCLAKETSA